MIRMDLSESPEEDVKPQIRPPIIIGPSQIKIKQQVIEKFTTIECGKKSSVMDNVKHVTKIITKPHVINLFAPRRSICKIAKITPGSPIAVNKIFCQQLLKTPSPLPNTRLKISGWATAVP